MENNITEKQLKELARDTFLDDKNKKLKETQEKLQKGLGKYAEIDLTQSEEIFDIIEKAPEKYMKQLNAKPTKRKFSILNPEERKRRFLRQLRRSKENSRIDTKKGGKRVWVSNGKNTYSRKKHGYIFKVKPGYEL